MHALNANEEMKMKKINYFGNEYMVSDKAKWVATSSNGRVLAFTEEPQIYWNAWITVSAGTRVGMDSIGANHWKNSLRKVEDILVKEGHPHADLMLKYAMIAQYDDKPWENFECDLLNGVWCDMFDTAFHPAFNYRLKPQEPKIQVGQIWVSNEGVEVAINVQSNRDAIVFTFKVGGMTYSDGCSKFYFLQNFKRKE